MRNFTASKLDAASERCNIVKPVSDVNEEGRASLRVLTYQLRFSHVGIVPTLRLANRRSMSSSAHEMEAIILV